MKGAKRRRLHREAGQRKHPEWCGNMWSGAPPILRPGRWVLSDGDVVIATAERLVELRGAMDANPDAVARWAPTESGP